jgi:hypothetical protein
VHPVELLTVADLFQLTGLGLTFVPDFAVPSHWRNLKAPARVITPSGEVIETVAQFNATHFNIRDPQVPVERRWRVVVTLPEVQKEQVPIGSKLFVSSEVRDAVLGAAAV